jgi:general transcription factor 3C polypeptide 5 (transcription factor C subunit 1)
MDSNTVASDEQQQQQQQAPWLPIPVRAVSVVEHPCIVRNVDKGIASLGGSLKLSKVRCWTK